MKKKPTPWKEVQLRTLGLYLSEPGRGGQTFTYAAVVYEVTETDGKDYRTRTETGPALYAHADGYDAMVMEAIRPLYSHLMRRGRKGFV